MWPVKGQSISCSQGIITPYLWQASVAADGTPSVRVSRGTCGDSGWKTGISAEVMTSAGCGAESMVILLTPAGLQGFKNGVVTCSAAFN